MDRYSIMVMKPRKWQGTKINQLMLSGGGAKKKPQCKLITLHSAFTGSLCNYIWESWKPQSKQWMSYICYTMETKFVWTST